MGSLVFGEDDDELEDAVMRLLAKSEQTLCTVEAGTAGSLAKWLSRAAGQQNHYLGGQVIHSPSMLVQLLGPAMDLVGQFGPASREVAEAMAVSCRQQSGADFALAIGPFPAGGAQHPEIPFFFSLATPSKVTVKASSLVGHNSIWTPRAAKAAMNLLRLTLLGELKERLSERMLLGAAPGACSIITKVTLARCQWHIPARRDERRSGLA